MCCVDLARQLHIQQGVWQQQQQPAQAAANMWCCCAQSSAERCVQLNCKHCFHELCVRGWTMVGKKDTCPVCLEKVDLRSVHDRPWDSTNLNW